MNHRTLSPRLPPVRNRYFFASDIILLVLAAYLSYVLRLETFDLTGYWTGFVFFAGLVLLIVPLVFRWSGIYARYWRYASVEELLLLIGSVNVAVVLAGGIGLGAARLLPELPEDLVLPRSVPLIFLLLTLVATAGPRLAVRSAARYERRNQNSDHSSQTIPRCGFGRTGEWFATDVFDVEPDIVCVAKAIANGFPLGATAARAEIMQKWGPASHGTTCGGNPVSCAAALAVLDIIREENLLENARVQGTYLLEQLRELQTEVSIIGDVRGVGLMTAVEFIKPGTDREPNPEVIQRVLRLALDKGLLLYPCGHWTQTIRLIPALTMTRDQVDEGLEIFFDAVLEAA